jgi:hypothetical protein
MTIIGSAEQPSGFAQPWTVATAMGRLVLVINSGEWGRRRLGDVLAPVVPAAAHTNGQRRTSRGFQPSDQRPPPILRRAAPRATNQTNRESTVMLWRADRPRAPTSQPVQRTRQSPTAWPGCRKRSPNAAPPDCASTPAHQCRHRRTVASPSGEWSRAVSECCRSCATHAAVTSVAPWRLEGSRRPARREGSGVWLRQVWVSL